MTGTSSVRSAVGTTSTQLHTDSIARWDTSGPTVVAALRIATAAARTAPVAAQLLLLASPCAQVHRTRPNVTQLRAFVWTTTSQCGHHQPQPRGAGSWSLRWHWQSTSVRPQFITDQRCNTTNEQGSMCSGSTTSPVGLGAGGTILQQHPRRRPGHLWSFRGRKT